MKLKKCNAILSLLSALTLLIHILYNIFAYAAFFYDPTLKMLTALPFIIIVCAHAICGMCSVFLLGDGTCPALYPKQNVKTIIQRVSAALIFPLLIIHLNSYSLLKKGASESMALFVLIIILQLLFFAVIASHTAVSFSNAFITLGILSDINKKRMIDIAMIIMCALLFITAAFCIIRGELIMFFSE
ncbi:MAG: hypothetical protein K6F86_11460 [Lachnospiraceae bacterium]|nr:hypothetical protein [Lachnospiraceae bacterium]